MPTWILDDGPLGILARFADPNVAASWPHDFWVAEQTALDANDGNRAKLLEAGSIQTLHFDMGSRAAEILYEHLRDSASTSTTNRWPTSQSV
ncbi:MAG: hypothetical protein KAI47_14635 [Deltaproteobacteria bacterium]|nr:hypothetical protein [Deltaproteobacteria bacterium]